MILVTGGAGFLGYHLCLALLARDPSTSVFVVDDLSSPRSRERAELLMARAPVRVRVVVADLLEWLGRLQAPDLRFAEVWHLASPASPRLYKVRPLDTLRLGGVAVDRLISMADEHHARLIFASTSEVYGNPEIHPQPESYAGRVHCDGPRSCYDEAKRYGEALCAVARGIGQSARVVRIFNTYGPELDDGRLVPALLRSAATGEDFELHGDGLQRRTLAYVSDTIAGMLAVGKAEPGALQGPINVGSDLDPELSVLAIAKLVQALPGAKRFRIVSAPMQDAHDPQRRRPDLTRLRGLGWTPRVSLAEGLATTLEWTREIARR